MQCDLLPPPDGAVPAPPSAAGAAAAVADPERLAAVRSTGLLDTESEEAFDRLTRLAVRLVGVPAAFVSLVDADRDFYKSACGFGEPLATTRELAGPTFCHYAVQRTTPLIIPDTAADPVYRDVPTVRSLGVAAYVGVPLVVAGQAVGAFCAIDTQPRGWTAEDVEVLTELARSAQREIELRLALAASNASSEQLREQQIELEVSNQQLQDQATELEMQAQALQETARALTDHTLAAETAERRLQAAFAQAPAAVAVTTGPEHRFVLANPAYARLVSRVVRVGETFADELPEISAQGFTALLDGVFASGTAHVARETHAWVMREGDVAVEGWFDFVYQPLLDAANQVIGLMQLGVEVTHQVRARAEVDAARREAEAANRAKAEFLATMSHELRTPLNAIGGYTELIELGIHGPVTDAQRAALARIQTSQRHLLGLIAGVLDYARVEAGAVSYRLRDIQVAQAVAEAEVLVSPQLRAKGLGYAWAGAAPDMAVRADREKLQQILLNLLGNAVKFTHPREGVPGRVEVSCTATDGQVSIHVGDTGDGIAPEHLQQVFDPFVQVDQRLTREHEGVGLGLAISRDLARGMGGDLTGESAVGVGSVFTLRLPRV